MFLRQSWSSVSAVRRCKQEKLCKLSGRHLGFVLIFPVYSNQSWRSYSSSVLGLVPSFLRQENDELYNMLTFVWPFPWCHNSPVWLSYTSVRVPGSAVHIAVCSQLLPWIVHAAAVGNNSLLAKVGPSPSFSGQLTTTLFHQNSHLRTLKLLQPAIWQFGK
jgi:hypothetical protein